MSVAFSVLANLGATRAFDFDRFGAIIYIEHRIDRIVAEEFGLSSQPISITRAKLIMPMAELRSKLEVQIAEGEKAQKTWIPNWDELQNFNAQAEVWRDFSHEVLLCAFDSAHLASGLLKNMESTRTSGSLEEWISDAKQSLVRGVAYLRSIEKRLALIPEAASNTATVRAAHAVRTSTQKLDLIEKIQALKTILIDHVTGTRREEAEYRALREEIRSQQDLSPLLPQIFRDCIDLGSAWDYLKRFKHYAERRS